MCFALPVQAGRQSFIKCKTSKPRMPHSGVGIILSRPKYLFSTLWDEEVGENTAFPPTFSTPQNWKTLKSYKELRDLDYCTEYSRFLPDIESHLYVRVSHLEKRRQFRTNRKRKNCRATLATQMCGALIPKRLSPIQHDRVKKPPNTKLLACTYN